MSFRTHLLLALLPLISTAPIPLGAACAALVEAAAALWHPDTEDDDPGDGPTGGASTAAA